LKNGAEQHVTYGRGAALRKALDEEKGKSHERERDGEGIHRGQFYHHAKPEKGGGRPLRRYTKTKNQIQDMGSGRMGQGGKHLSSTGCERLGGTYESGVGAKGKREPVKRKGRKGLKDTNKKPNTQKVARGEELTTSLEGGANHWALKGSLGEKGGKIRKPSKLNTQYGGQSE